MLWNEVMTITDAGRWVSKLAEALYATTSPQTVFYTASPNVLSEHPYIAVRKALYEKVNIVGICNLLECAGELGSVKAFVYTSSASVVRDSINDLLDADETLRVLKVTQQTEIYSHTKAVAEQLVLAANRKYGPMLTISMRPTNMFGEGDEDTNSPYLDLASTEEFLASHVLRIPSPQSTGEGNVRDSRGKAKQFNTINGRTVVIKESFVYSNKGFRNLSQAQLLSDQLFHPDSLDTQQWLIYYISRPLTGSYEPIKITPATLPGALKSLKSTDAVSGVSKENEFSTSSAGKKDVKTFNDLLNNFPMIARQMQSGLEIIFKEFSKDVIDWIPSVHSRKPSTVSQEFSDTTTLKSNDSIHSKYSNGHPKSPSLVVTLRSDEEENRMSKTLESAVTAAIDLFQKVDKQQLSFLGSTTELTGPVVEKMIERYVAEQLHDSFLFPRLCNSHKMEDLELESKIHCMQHIDVAQVGIAIEDGRRGKDQLVTNITKGAGEFRKLGVAGSPQQMLEILLATQKLVTSRSACEAIENSNGQKQYEEPSEKPLSQAMNADTLVSLLLVVVIRSQVRHLHARLSYMRNFVFIDDIEGGEIGYALSTFEAVLSYLATDSGGLRKASQRNKRLWQATRQGDIDAMKSTFEASGSAEEPLDGTTPLTLKSNEEAIDDEELDSEMTRRTAAARSRNSHVNREPRTPIGDSHTSESSTLAHVFPFQAALELRKSKRVSMDMRSLSNSSDYSFISRTTTLDSNISAVEGDTSVETLAQTQDMEGNSILMMAVEARQYEALAYLLSLEDFYPTKSILEDTNNEGTTLLSAAVQLNSFELIRLLLDRIFETRDEEKILDYFKRPDSRGRTVAHYLFNAPWLLPQLGEMLPWRMKDRNGQTPLLALCRSYDHPNYFEMVDVALGWAARQQNDGQLLHLDDHVDAKGNTLLHVVNESSIALRLLQHCDSDPNATNDKQFTPLMVASKYGRMDMVRALFGDPRVDVLAREQRGMTAVELAKDDEIRNRIDDMMLVSSVPAADGRVTAVARSFFVEDASVRMIIKSATRNDNGMIGVTTCRRSLTDFENLAKWLALEHPASWLPSIFNFRSPFQIPSRPSRAVLQDIQIRLDQFLKIMLQHSTFSTHELLWEFILFPEIQPDMMAERSRKKAEIRVEKILEEYEPADDVGDISSFVEHARESIRGVHHSTKEVMRRITSVRMGCSNYAIAADISAKYLATLTFLPQTHITAFSRFAACTQLYASDPHKQFYHDISAVSSTILAILSSLARPHSLIKNLTSIQKSIDRHSSSFRRSDRWPLGLLDETRKGIHAEAQEKAEKSRKDLINMGCELSYTQQIVASELAGWQELHAKLGRRAIRNFARQTVVREKDRLERMKRAVKTIVESKEQAKR
ncbi:MAG: hypothetical protein Q9217_004801 [Psora testacea]